MPSSGSVSRVPGGAGCGGLASCLRGRVACVFLALRAAIGVLWVSACSSPPFFVAAGVTPWVVGVGGWRRGVFLVLCLLREIWERGWLWL